MAHPVLGEGAARRLAAVGAVRVLQRDDAGDLAQPLLPPLLRGDDGEHAGHLQRGRGVDRQDLRRGVRRCAGRSRARPRPARCRPCSVRRPSAGADPRCAASAGSARTWPWRVSPVPVSAHHVLRTPLLGRGGRPRQGSRRRHAAASPGITPPFPAPAGPAPASAPLPGPGSAARPGARRTSPSPAPASSGTRRRASGS